MRRKLTENLTVQVLSDTDPDTAPGTPRVLPAGTEIVLEAAPASRRPLPDAAALQGKKTFELVILPAGDGDQPEVLRLTRASWSAARSLDVAADAEPELKSFNGSLNGITGAGRKLAYGWLNAAGFRAAPSPDDVVQGASGSCFVLSVAAASVIAHPNVHGWHAHPWQQVITPVGRTNSLYKVIFRRDGQPHVLYVSAAVPFFAGDPFMAGANADIAAGNNLALPAWPAILEKAWIQFTGDFFGDPESVMRAVGMSEVAGAHDATQIPGLFAQGRAIVVKGNRHGYYVSAAVGQQVTVVDQRTPPANRAAGNAVAVTRADANWNNYVVTSTTWPRPFILNTADFAAANLTYAHGRPA